MANVLLIVEGESEEQFYKRHLAPLYAARGVYVSVTMMPGKRGFTSRSQRGGRVSYASCLDTVRRFLRQAGHCQLVALVYDYYGLDATFTVGLALPAGQVATGTGWASLIRQRLESELGDPRFHFFLQLHEFEAYLFCRPDLVARHFKAPALEASLTAALATCGNQPEAINDHPATAPSRRLAAALAPAYYGKTTDGVAIAEAIGVAAIREQCPTFDAFCRRLDELSFPATGGAGEAAA